jgi:thioredoxin-dependent peroxiredoxin
MKKSGEKIDLSLFPSDLGIADSKYTVIYFYPKDNTPGCTTEACEFRDFNQDISKLGVTVIGVSVDSQKSHDKFVEKFKLNFPLVSDEDKKIVSDFGVWAEKSMMGRKYMGILRTTFLINSTGEIINIWENVKPNGHAREVLEYLQTLG